MVGTKRSHQPMSQTTKSARASVALHLPALTEADHSEIARNYSLSDWSVCALPFWLKCSAPNCHWCAGAGRRCYCEKCVKERSPDKVGTTAPKIRPFEQEMRNYGFRDDNAWPKFDGKWTERLLEQARQIDQSLVDDVVFLAERINSLPSAAPVTSVESVFTKQIADIRSDYRKSRLTIGHDAIRHGGVFSIRVKTEPAANRQHPTSFDTRSLGFCGVDGEYDGEVIPIWHTPNHVRDAKVPIEGHFVEIGDRRVPIDELYSQEEYRASVNGKEVVITDFWAVKYKSGWRGFIDPYINVKKKKWNKDAASAPRERDEFFEPSAEQIEKWTARYTSNGAFKTKQHPRFMAKAFDPKFNYRGNKEQAGAAPLSSRGLQKNTPVFSNPFQFTRGKGSWRLDPKFIIELNRDRVLGTLFSNPTNSIYVGPDIHVDIPDLLPSRDSDRSTFAIENNLIGRITGIGFRPTAEQLTETEQLFKAGDVEKALKVGEDFDSNRYAELHHYYEYNYQYYPPEILPQSSPLIVKQKPVALLPVVLEVGWDKAIENKFGLSVLGEVPTNGFYVMYKINLMTPTKVYLIAPTGTGSDESVGPFEPSDILSQTKATAEQIRTGLKPATVVRNLRDKVGGQMAHISFWMGPDGLHWRVDDRLTFSLGRDLVEWTDTRLVPVS